VSGDVSFKDPYGVSFGLSSGNSFGDEVLGSLLINHAGEHDPVKSTVRLAVSALVEPMFRVQPARQINWGHAANADSL